MITKEKRIEKICSFYASDYHLEMIMLPYINKKIEENANINIITEKNLVETIKTVISKVNFSQERKQKILDIDWRKKSIDTINLENNKQELVIFIVGCTDYINKTNKQIEEFEMENNMKIINCYSIAEVQNDITEIVLKHSKILNTTEEKEID